MPNENYGDVPPEYRDPGFVRKVCEGVFPASNTAITRKKEKYTPQSNEVNEDTELLRKLNDGVAFG